MSSNEIAIQVSKLSKCYQIYESPRDRLKQFVLPRVQRLFGLRSKQYYRQFWALKDISFKVNRGETVGIIGRNGSGKSTLLQMICGTLTPTEGEVNINGRVAALLELGSGFNPEFTGRENIYLNAVLLGLNRLEIAQKINSILAFADIGDFVEQPVKTYSSGMVVRLAFAVIAHVDAEILVIDEALAVGDIYFQQKCMRYLRDFQANGGTVFFVSHDTAAITSLCSRAILLSNQALPITGTSEEVTQIYIQQLYAERDSSTLVELNSESSHPAQEVACAFDGDRRLFDSAPQTENVIQIGAFQKSAVGFGHGGAEILDVWFQNDQGSLVHTVYGGEPVHMCFKVAAYQKIKWPAFGFMLKDRLGQYVIAEGTDLAFRQHAMVIYSNEVVEVVFSFVMPLLIAGEYSMNVAVAEGMGDDHIQHCWMNDALVLTSLKSRLVHGICGLHQLGMQISISSAHGKVCSA